MRYCIYLRWCVSIPLCLFRNFFHLFSPARNRYSVQFSSVAHLCPTLCDPMNRRTPGLPVHHQLPQSTQTQVHRVGDAIQPSHPLSSPSPPALKLSQHQDLFPMNRLFTSGGQSIGVSASTSVLPMARTDFL